MNPQQLYDAILLHRATWKKISKMTRGEHETEDVLNTAWLLAHKWKEFDPSNHQHQQKLFGMVYNKLVKFAEKNLRHATRLDQPSRHFDPDESTHPLLNILHDERFLDPLVHLISEEDASHNNSFEKQIKQLGNSLLAGFILFLERLNQTRRKTATDWNMDVSWLYRCIKRAKAHYDRQLSLFDHSEILLNHAQLASWRSFKIYRKQSDFKNEQMQLKLSALPEARR